MSSRGPVTKTVGGIEVTFTPGYASWDLPDPKKKNSVLKWHVNWTLGDTKKGKAVYHLTNENINPKGHYFFTLEGGEITDALPPPDMRGKNDGKFSACPDKAMKKFVEDHISELITG